MIIGYKSGYSHLNFNKIDTIMKHVFSAHTLMPVANKLPQAIFSLNMRGW